MMPQEQHTGLCQFDHFEAYTGNGQHGVDFTELRRIISVIELEAKSAIPVAERSNCSPEAGPTNNAQHESAETKIIESAPSCVR